MAVFRVKSPKTAVWSRPDATEHDPFNNLKCELATIVKHFPNRPRSMIALPNLLVQLFSYYME